MKKIPHKPRIRFSNGKWKVFSEASGFNLDQAMIFVWKLNQSLELKKLLVVQS